jgi:sorbose reductase
MWLPHCAIHPGGNRGIGFAISEAIAKAGGNVAIIYVSLMCAAGHSRILAEYFTYPTPFSQRSAKDAKDVAAKLASDHNVKSEAWQCDVGDAELVKKTFKDIDEKFGNVHGCVTYIFIAQVIPLYN